MKDWYGPQEFFLICPLGLEDLAQQEIESFEIKCLQKLPGGLSFEAPLENILEILGLLKIPIRVLWRLGSWKIRDFPRLYRKVVSLPWNLFLNKAPRQVKVQSADSRLFASDRIESTILDGLLAFEKKSALKKIWLEREYSCPFQLFFRAQEDQVTLSLDLCGRPLYQRHPSPGGNEAPLRENLAYACAKVFLSTCPGQILWDPFCGSGTLLYEALGTHHPKARPLTWEETPLGARAQSRVSPAPPLFTGKVLASDLRSPISPFPFVFEKKNFFDYTESPGPGCLILSNPPYGERLKRNFSLEEILSQAKKLKIEALGLILPRDQIPPQALVLRFRHGGLDCGLGIWKKFGSGPASS